MVAGRVTFAVMLFFLVIIVVVEIVVFSLLGIPPVIPEVFG